MALKQILAINGENFGALLKTQLLKLDTLTTCVPNSENCK